MSQLITEYLTPEIKLLIAVAARTIPEHRPDDDQVRYLSRVLCRFRYGKTGTRSMRRDLHARKRLADGDQPAQRGTQTGPGTGAATGS